MSHTEPHDEFLELCAVSTSGQLTQEEQKRLEEHLVVCASCRQAIKQYETLVAHALPAMAADEVPGDLEPGPSWSQQRAEAALFDRIAQEENPEKAAQGETQSDIPDAARRVLPFAGEATWRLAGSNDAFFAPVRLDPNHEPELTVMKTGPFKGFTRMTMKFIASIGDRIVNITLVVYAITAELAQEFHAKLRDLLGASPLTLADAIIVARNELKKNHQLSDDDLTKQLRTEVGGTLVVEVLRASVAAA